MYSMKECAVGKCLGSILKVWEETALCFGAVCRRHPAGGKLPQLHCLKQWGQWRWGWGGLESGGLTPVDFCLDSIEEAASSFYDYVLS